MNRRNFLKTVGQIMVGTTLAGCGGIGYATRVEPERLVVESVRVPLKNLNPVLEGFKIVQISDIHLHPYTQIEFVQECIEIINNLQPDLVVLTGDYVLQGAESIFELAPVLAGLNAKHGIFAVLGNHDLWTDAGIIHQALETSGLVVLKNQGVSLGVGKSQLYLAGVDDIWSGQPDLDAALDNTPLNTPVILLAHEPDFADIAAQNGKVSLQLSGHSHGGQVRLPGIGAPVLPYLGQKYDQGLNRSGDTWVYTTRGIGVIGPPIRFNCPPEITDLTLAGS